MLPGAIALLVICYLDLLSSIVVINLGLAAEAGPVLAQYHSIWGMPGLISGKIFLVALGFFVIETAWRAELVAKNRAGAYYWLCTAAFLLLYAILFFQKNGFTF